SVSEIYGAVGGPVQRAECFVHRRLAPWSDELEVHGCRAQTEGWRGDLEAPVLPVAGLAEDDAHDLGPVPGRRQEPGDHEIQARGCDRRHRDEQRPTA